ncbi:DNA binding domain, excisionase family [Mycobacteroides abscessus subsp. abscessus]|uniref:helix-turn-helix domain-containing protein n=1 Tax=Mycobacteroides abscessus TaxID=36809 RepID=UPI0009A87EC9|nr:helix-turn-helix domain-containing protein [Mycobacteroides abscessus]SLJ22946.1 DNA binding domain, excisionase family [Mycobacteroides abscessus subsp. abscessus]
MAEDEKPELMTVAEVAALRKVSVETVRRRIKAGLIPVVRAGGRVLIRREDALQMDPATPQSPDEARAQIAQFIRRSSKADPELRGLLDRLEAGEYGPLAQHPNA